MMVLFPFKYLFLTRVQWLPISWTPIYFLIASTKYILSGWLVASLKVKVYFTDSFMEARGLVKLGRLSGKDLALSSWWIRLDTKLAVSIIMDLVVDMDTYAKMEIMLNTFDMPFSLFSLSWILLLCLNPEVQRFAYSGIRREDYEGKSCSSSLGEASFAASRLNSAGFCAILEWLTWWTHPRWWAPYTMEGIGVSDMPSVPCADSGSFIMALGVTWGSDPVGRSLGPGSRESSCLASLGSGMFYD